MPATAPPTAGPTTLFFCAGWFAWLAATLGVDWVEEDEDLADSVGAELIVLGRVEDEVGEAVMTVVVMGWPLIV